MKDLYLMILADLNKDLDNYSDDKNLGQDIKKDFVKIVDFLFVIR